MNDPYEEYVRMKAGHDLNALIEDIEYCSAQDAALALGVSVSTVSRYISKGRLPALKVGKLLRVNIKDLETFKGLCNLKGAAGILKVHPSTLLKLIKDGRLKAVRCTSCAWVIDKKDIAALQIPQEET